MFIGRMRLEWDQTSQLWLLLCAVNTPKGKPQKRLEHIHPLWNASHQRSRNVDPGEAVPAADLMSTLKAMV